MAVVVRRRWAVAQCAKFVIYEYIINKYKTLVNCTYNLLERDRLLLLAFNHSVLLFGIDLLLGAVQPPKLLPRILPHLVVVGHRLIAFVFGLSHNELGSQGPLARDTTSANGHAWYS